MTATKRFSAAIVHTLQKGKSLGIKAGEGDHRFIGIWVVVVQDRVFVRSWDQMANGWYRTLREEPVGTIRVNDREVAVRAVFTRGERIKHAVDAAYAEKYNTPGARHYVRGFAEPARRATTTELVPRARS